MLLTFLSTLGFFDLDRAFDFLGILRAVIKNQLAGRKKQGASTITQQVARLLLLKSQEKKYKRKKLNFDSEVLSYSFHLIIIV